jgi:hypothetical protein
MKNKKALIALLALMAVSFFAVGNLSAQTLPPTPVVVADGTPEDEMDLEALNPQNQAELQVLLVTLGERYQVDLVVLNGLIDKGYGVQEIWLALEIQKATGSTLEDALAKAKGVDGHGWGLLAKVLGIKPGSAEFMALKGKIAKGNKDLADELKNEREKQGKGNAGNEGGAGKGQGKGKN